jgi:hypothetical protein
MFWFCPDSLLSLDKGSKTKDQAQAACPQERQPINTSLLHNHFLALSS